MNQKRTVIIIIVVVVFMLLLLAAGIGAVVFMAHKGPHGGGDIGLIRIEGVITSGRGSASFLGESGAGAERIIDMLEEFRKNDSLKSLVLRINSPGGSAAGSQEIYQEIMRLRSEGKKVTVSMGDVAASGGYYIASAANRIYADPASLTGSIGVIMEAADIHELLNRFGVELSAIKSGKHKDMGSSSRPMTSEERKIFQGLINDVFDQFVTDVSKGRKLSKKEVLRLADGRVYTGRQALKLKLIDRTGSLEDALKAAAKDAGIKGEFDVVEFEKELGLLDMLMGSTESRFQGSSASLENLARALLKADPQMNL